MRTRRIAAFAALIIGAVGAAPTVALADTTTGNVIHVDNQPGSDRVGTGTGAGTASNVSGTASAPITIEAAPGTHPLRRHLVQ